MEVNREEKVVSKHSVSLEVSFLLVQDLVHLVLNTYYPLEKYIYIHVGITD